MTEANLLIKGDKAFLDADLKSKTFTIDSTFQNQLIQYLVKNNIRVINTEKLNWKLVIVNELSELEVNYEYWHGFQIRSF